MKSVYPVVLTEDKNTVMVFVPDFNIYTEGKDFADAIEMARDAISLAGICIEDEGLNLPTPSDIASIKKQEGEVVTLVDVDFDDYRKRND
ncbi:MAG: type II toxin-antitoxin system HicB family antitoxin [Clostridia bacterium]|nr:type II toxin-antitoxin system HicB family antitoxin [Clostridia bacterium]